MAISKWISFGNTPNTSAPTVPPPSEATVPVATAADEKHFGLENFGNTCYANSVLQALYFCGPFRDLIVQYPDPSTLDITLSPPAIPIPPPVSPPPTYTRPKSSRKPSISDSFHPHNCQPSCQTLSPSTPAGLPIPLAPPTLLSALRSLYIHISRNPADKGTVAPRAFIDKLKELNELFRSTMHQDAHEFLNYLLNQIVEEIDEDRKKANGNGSPRTSPSGEELSTSVASLASSAVPPPSTASMSATQPINTTLVHRLFEGVLTSETRCLTCETVSSRDECFLDLSIDIEQNSSVTACLRQFSASEMLCQKNKFFCDSCCDLQEAEKRMKIKKLPNVLALHLKRFKYQEDLGRYIKLTYRVAFPFELRLFNTVDDAENPDRLYQLFAIVVHIGNGPHHGHYVSVVKARGTWYLFDDDTVEPMKESEIPKYFGESNAGSAYVLYYQAVDLDLSALGLRPPTVASSVGQPTEAPSQTASLPSTAECSELDPPSPAVPPGLTEPASADRNVPSPSPSPPTFTSPFTGSSTQPGSQPTRPLHIQIPSNSTEPAPVSPVTPGGSSRGLLRSLRRPPSLSARMRSVNASSGSDLRKSMVDSPPVPPIPIASGSSREHDESNPTELGERSVSPMSPSALYGSPPIVRNTHINGKDKEKSGSGTWFKRKSLRADKPPTSMPLGIAERSPSLGGAGLEDGSAPWYKSTKRVMRRASEAGLADHPVDLAIPSSAPDPTAVLRTTSTSPVLRPVPEHKKSSPELTVIGKSEGRASRHRPATAGAYIGRPNSVASPPLPPMPSPQVSPPPDSRSREPNTSPHPRTHDDRNGGHSWRHSHQRPHTSHSPMSPSNLGFSTSNGTSSTLSTSAGESVTNTFSTTGALKLKRATRKLSLTAPMLGFGRRDKDKDKRPQSPATQYTSRDR